MELLKFKTNIDSQVAFAKVETLLDQQKAISQWDIDLESEDHILSVSGENLDPQKIENAVQQAGYQVEPLRVLGIYGKGL
ncbi:MAG: heavy-metal-associated domain-containing protein [Rufibacter sp.]